MPGDRVEEMQGKLTVVCGTPQNMFETRGFEKLFFYLHCPRFHLAHDESSLCPTFYCVVRIWMNHREKCCFDSQL